MIAYVLCEKQVCIEDDHLTEAQPIMTDNLVAAIPGDRTLLIVEDIHWADEASLDLLLHLARSAPTQGLLLLLTLRS